MTAPSINPLEGSGQQQASEEQRHRRTLLDDKVDPAALVGVVVATAITVAIQPGRYTWISLMIGLTVLFILFGFYGDTPVNPLPSTLVPDAAEGSRQDRVRSLRRVAFAAATGLCAQLIVGPFRDMDTNNLLQEWDRMDATTITPSEVPLDEWVINQSDSNVSGGEALLIWLTVTGLVFLWYRIGDRLKANRQQQHATSAPSRTPAQLELTATEPQAPGGQSEQQGK